MKRLADKYNAKPAVIEAFQPKDRDFSSQMTKVKNSGADGLFFLAMYDPAALGAKTLQQMGYKAQIMGLGALTDVKLVELGGEAVLGTINTQMYVAEGKTQEDRDFIKAFQSKHNTLPTTMRLWYDSLKAQRLPLRNRLDPVEIQCPSNQDFGHWRNFLRQHWRHHAQREDRKWSASTLRNTR